MLGTLYSRQQSSEEAASLDFVGVTRADDVAWLCVCVHHVRNM
jgi:hypothetical protein